MDILARMVIICARMHAPGLYPGQISFSPLPPDTTWCPGGNIDRPG